MTKKLLATLGVILLLGALVLPRSTSAQNIVRAMARVGTNLLFSPDGTWSIGANGASRPLNLFLAGSAIVSGNISASNILPTTGLSLLSPTGVTPDGNSSPETRQFSFKTTVDRTAFVCAALTCDVNLFTLPIHSIVMHAMGDLTTTFACASTCTTGTLSLTLGKSAGGTDYLASLDADAAVGQFGVTQASLGTALAAISTTVPNAGVIGGLANWGTTTTVSIRLTSGTGNIGNGSVTNLSQGSIIIYMTVTVYQ